MQLLFIFFLQTILQVMTEKVIRKKLFTRFFTGIECNHAVNSMDNLACQATKTYNDTTTLGNG